MEKTKSCQEGGIEFGDWRLVPLDSLNWELCHRHATTRGKDAGTVKWHREGRYYQCNTFHLALQYAADCELRAGCRDDAAAIMDALREYERIARDMANAVAASLREVGANA